MIRSRWFVVLWWPKVAAWQVVRTSRGRGEFQNVTIQGSEVAGEEGAFNIALGEAMTYLEVVSGKFVRARNLATAFRCRVDADRYAFECVQNNLDRLGKVEVRRLRQKLGPRFLLNRLRTCQKCGTYSVWTVLDWTTSKCSDQYECFRRQQMKMGSPLTSDGMDQIEMARIGEGLP